MSDQERKIIAQEQLNRFWEFLGKMGEAHTRRANLLSAQNPWNTGYAIPESIKEFSHEFLRDLAVVLEKL